ncbi:integrase [Mesorhizobium sp. 10J20-29]
MWDDRVGQKLAEIDSPSKRAKLAARKNPYWQGVGGGRGGVSLGYRKLSRGPGAWVGKIVVEGRRVEERIGTADDDGNAAGALTFRQAVTATLEWSRRQYASLQAEKTAAFGASVPTVESAVAEYTAARKARSARDGSNAGGRLKKHVLADKKFSRTPLSKLSAVTIADWRGRLAIRGQTQVGCADEAPAIAPSTLNRLMNDLRAALNGAAERHRRELPSHIAGEIKVGTRAVSTEDNARHQLLTEQEVRSAIEASFAADPDGDFGRLALTLATTGARHSQARLLRVRDVQVDECRIMMPGSRKGRLGRARAPVAIPVSADVVRELMPAIDGRGLDQPLLERWAYKRAGPVKWERSARRPWGPAYEVDKVWADAASKAKLPAGTTMYAFRHSSIVRGLKAGLPVRLVAALHDTSSEMIEKHYSAYIVDATEELSRRVTLSI